MNRLFVYMTMAGVYITLAIVTGLVAAEAAHQTHMATVVMWATGWGTPGWWPLATVVAAMAALYTAIAAVGALGRAFLAALGLWRFRRRDGRRPQAISRP